MPYITQGRYYSSSGKYINEKYTYKYRRSRIIKSVGDDWWIFGFDTFHYGDDKYNWDKQAVIQETMNLMEQIEK
jgi:hypothetical protein